VTNAGVEAPRRAAGSPDNPSEAVAAVVDNLGALARAELRLAAMEAKAWLLRISLGLVLVWLAMLLIQLFAGLVVISPLLFGSRPWPAVAATLAVSLGLSLVVSLCAVRELRRLKDLGSDAHHGQSQRH
jgi:hypothetical protein